jgi:hypothetical protein
MRKQPAERRCDCRGMAIRMGDAEGWASSSPSPWRLASGGCPRPFVGREACADSLCSEAKTIDRNIPGSPTIRPVVKQRDAQRHR